MLVSITGASGFVGRHLSAHLQAHGDDIIPLGPDDRGVDVTDRESVRTALERAKPDVVFHLAGQADVGASWHRPIETFRVNLEGTLHVLEACRAANVQKVIAVTSADIYGRITPDQLPLDEETPIRPVSPYAASKAAADVACIQAGLGYGQDVVRVRAFNHLGPGQSDRFVASALARRVAENEREGNEVVHAGDLTPRRDFTDVRDVVRAYRLLAEHGRAGEAYNLCSDTDHSVQELAERLLGLSTARMTLQIDQALVREVDLPVLRGSFTKLHAATGWQPEIDLDTTLADLLDWHRRLLADAD